MIYGGFYSDSFMLETSFTPSLLTTESNFAQNIMDVTIYESSVARLAPQTWIDDTLVDLTINKVISDLRVNLNELSLSVHCFPTTVYSVLDQDYRNPVKDKFTNYRNINDLDYLFFPMARSHHFSCIVIENVKAITRQNSESEVRIHHMDSKNGSHDHLQAINLVKHFLSSKLGNQEETNIRINKITSFGLLPIPQQSNTWDCGLFVSENIKHFLLGAMNGVNYSHRDNFKFDFSQVEISKKRIALYNELKSSFDQSKILANESITIVKVDDDTPNDGNENSNSFAQDDNNIIINDNKTDSNESSLIKVTELSTTDIIWDFTAVENTLIFFSNTIRKYISFKPPIQCTNAPQRALMCYRENYEPFIIYAHYEVDAVATKGKLYFSMCALYHATYGSNYILTAIAFTTCTAPVKRYWVYDKSADRFCEWNDRHLASFSCVPQLEFDEASLIIKFREYLICSRKLYDKDRGIKFTSKNATKSIKDIPKLDKFEGDFDETLAVWTGTRNPETWQHYLHLTGTS